MHDSAATLFLNQCPPGLATGSRAGGGVHLHLHAAVVALPIPLARKRRSF